MDWNIQVSYKDKLLSKVQKKINNIKCTVDIFQYESDILTVKGWAFSPEFKLENVHLVIKGQGKVFESSLKYGIKRTDVYQMFHCAPAKKCGFFGKVLVENMKLFKVYLTFSMKGKRFKLYLGQFNQNGNTESKIPPRVQTIENSDSGIDIIEILGKQEKYKFHFPEEFYTECVDIIVPVYNGYEFLDTLLNTIVLTKMKYRLILINDKSPDERVGTFLKTFAEGKDNVILLENKENLGFLQTVNRGFELCENHVALVNTDVELPEMWLERLMLPIFKDSEVASSTPYTNCGTICSFPEFLKDNELFLGLDVKTIDEEFLKIPPKYETMPTGVGYCMGVNRKVLQEIGGFDAESFGKGYGEENDWCQRALQKGYRNVQVENLFVYHKHGGSFLSEDKKRFLEEHEKILLEKHPYYNKDVARFCALDPNKEIREIVQLNLLSKSKKHETVLAFDHNLGGGATKYLSGKKKVCLNEGKAFVVVRFDFVQEWYKVLFSYLDYEIQFHVTKRKDLFKIMQYISVSEIWINEMVTYPELYDMLRDISKYANENHAEITMLIHDFFSVCPTINLLDYKEKYCCIPDCKVCNECLKSVKSLQSLEYESMEKWREEWLVFFKSCKEVVAFSNDSKNIVEKAFGMLDNIVVRPHQIDFIPTVDKKYKTTKTLNIGLLGVLTKHKGRTLIRKLTEIIEREGLNVRIILIGSSSKKINSPVFRETGPYTRDSIPRLLLENDIDIFLIPSIWPETFSYTTEEIMRMNMPVMCFDLGAPAERVRKYDKGIIIPEISPEAIIKSLRKEKIVKECMEKQVITKKILFVVEEITFSSRYRVDHMREQLLQQGIASDCGEIEDIHKFNLKKYSSVIVYRSSKDSVIRKLVQKAHRSGVKVYYDIDDYIFEYSQINNLKFLEGDDYVGFEEYSTNIHKTMELCDGFIVSTTNLKNAVKESFQGKPVVINRNVASMEMVTISMENHEKKNEKIRMGYFSGSKTHNEDFERIKDVILEIMKKNENVSLYIGGQIELSSEFNKVKERIEKFDFVSWKKLPNLIAQADINLMPLEETFFHACKSENKWMEAALVNVPTVATWNSELAAVIKNGENGYLCKDMDEWKESLEKLIDDKKLRMQIAKKAHEQVMQDYTTFHIEQDVMDLLFKG